MNLLPLIEEMAELALTQELILSYPRNLPWVSLTVEIENRHNLGKNELFNWFLATFGSNGCNHDRQHINYSEGIPLTMALLMIVEALKSGDLQ